MLSCYLVIVRSLVIDLGIVLSCYRVIVLSCYRVIVFLHVDLDIVLSCYRVVSNLRELFAIILHNINQ